MSKQYDVSHLIDLGHIDSDAVWKANQEGDDIEYNTSYMLSESQIALAALVEYSRIKKCDMEEASRNLSLRFFSMLDARSKEKDLDIIFTQPFELQHLFGEDNAVLMNVAYGAKPELIALHGNNHYALAALMPDGDGRILVEYYNSMTTPDRELEGLDSPHMILGKDFCDKTMQYIQGQGFDVSFVNKSLDQQLDNNCGLCVASNAAHRAANLPAEQPKNKREWTINLATPTFQLIDAGKESYLNERDVANISAAAGRSHAPPQSASQAQPRPNPSTARPSPLPQRPNLADKPFAGIFGDLGDNLAAAGGAMQPTAQLKGQNPFMPPLGKIFDDLEGYMAAAAATPKISKPASEQKQPDPQHIDEEDQEMKEALKRSLEDSQPHIPLHEYDFDEINATLSLSDKLFKGYASKDVNIKHASFHALSETVIPKITKFLEQEFEKEKFKYDKNNLGAELHRYVKARNDLPSDRKAFNRRLVDVMDTIQAIQLQNLEDKAREIGAVAREAIVHGGAGVHPQTARPTQHRGRS